MPALASIPAPPRTRKPRGQGASRRGEILDAATRIFLTEGVEGATMRRIAAAVGVSPTALYVYFPDKDAILQAIAEATFAKLLAVLEASQQGPGDTLEKFRAGLRSYVDFGLANPDAYRLTLMASPRFQPGEHCPDIPSADHSFAILQRGVEDLMQAGYFRPDASEAVAETICACTHGITALLIIKSDFLGTDHEDLIQRVIDTTIAGLR